MVGWGWGVGWGLEWGFGRNGFLKLWVWGFGRDGLLKGGGRILQAGGGTV